MNRDGWRVSTSRVGPFYRSRSRGGKYDGQKCQSSIASKYSRFKGEVIDALKVAKGRCTLFHCDLRLNSVNLENILFNIFFVEFHKIQNFYFHFKCFKYRFILWNLYVHSKYLKIISLCSKAVKKKLMYFKNPKNIIRKEKYGFNCNYKFCSN